MRCLFHRLPVPRYVVRFLTVLWCLLACVAGPARALEATQLALVINSADPVSVEVGEIYRQQRGIPRANVISVAFAHDSGTLPREAFERLHAEVLAKLPPGIEAFALAWTRPWRAGCMGITAAFAFGYDEAFCSKACAATLASRYFNGGRGVPGNLPQPRPAMLLAAESVAEARALIARGVAADYRYPQGTVYLVRTEDTARNVRAVLFEDSARQIRGLHFAILPASQAQERKDVAGYFTGAVQVPALPTLHFLPGAPADHLTSFGGQLLDNPGQMSALQWLKAGATGSYGTVVEPCNHLAKFPHPGVLMGHYASGDTLIEAYWKSVAWPGEGVFIGEPLARPYGTRALRDAQGWWMEGHSANGRTVRVETASEAAGPFKPALDLWQPAGYARIPLLLPEDIAAVRIRW